MRRLTLSPLALVLLLAAATCPAAESGRTLVVALAPARAGEPPGAAAARARAAERFASLGLTVRGALADGIRLATAAVAPDDPFDLDPARVLCVEAADSAAADRALERLAADPEVEWAERDVPREPAWLADGAFPDDPDFVAGRQWGLRNLGPAGPYGGLAGADIGALAAWARSTGGNDVVLAVADTGIDPAHPEFVTWLPDGRPRLMPGFNAALDPGGAIADSFAHGTLVAGVMAARTGEGVHFDSLGIAGVCGGDGIANLGCRLLPIKITPGRSGFASSFSIARAMVYAASAGARAMNLSFAGSLPSRVERLALYHALVRGCVVVAAAGNRGASTPTAPQYPAAFAADGLCIQAGSSDMRDRRSVFSSYGPGLDLLAPGESIRTTYMTYPSAAGVAYDGYVLAAGTSFAAPHAAGVVGLLAGLRPELIDTDLQRVMRESAHDIGLPGVDPETGWGRLDAAAALAAVEPGLGIWHDEAAATGRRSAGLGTLVVGEAGPGSMSGPRAWENAELVELSASVAIPDSFLPPVRAWPRLGGTSTVRPGFSLPYFVPWSELAEQRADGFTLRGYLYQVPDALAPGGVVPLPLPLDQGRFAFTVVGRVDRPPDVQVLSPRPGDVARFGDSLSVAWRAADPDSVTWVEVRVETADGASGATLERLPGDRDSARVAIPCAGLAAGPARVTVVAGDDRGPRVDQGSASVPVTLAPGRCPGVAAATGRGLGAAPNPFRASTWLSTPWPGTLMVLDVGGRVVARRAVSPGEAGVLWDGRDDHGRRLPAGLYFARLEGSPGAVSTRLVRVD
jgi:subtilisin family serine protease